jgi:hypothetical protein|tara:strand:+ start:693 stop:833 length:141 start_codon:yes stop_codon:yes gene_type:complete
MRLDIVVVPVAAERLGIMVVVVVLVLPVLAAMPLVILQGAPGPLVA